jgi:hypothetical protein
MLQRFKIELEEWLVRIGLIRGRKVETQEEYEAKHERIYVSRLVILKISERMRGREQRMKADRKRRFRMARRAKMLVKHKDMGLVDDEKYGEKSPRMSIVEARIKLCS